MAPNWSLLPTELLEIISRKIADIADFARFRSVCKSWRYAANPINLSPQLPWLLLPYDPNTSYRSFFSLSTRSTYTLDLPQTLNQNIYGSSNGWLVMFDLNLNISFFNPLTRSLIRLPPITTFPEDYKDRFLRAGDGGYVHRNPELGSEDVITFEKTEEYFDCYAYLPPPPPPSSIDDGCRGIVAFIVSCCPQIQYWRPGDEAWTMIGCGVDGAIQAMAFHNGKFYVIDHFGNTAVCDVGTPPGKAEVIPSLKLNGHFSFYRYLVVLPEEELLLVTCSSEYPNPDVREMSFEYHKLEEDERGMNWRKVERVGDCAVFLTEGTRLHIWKLMTAASNAPGHEWNRLYCVLPWKNCHGIAPKLCQTDVILMEDELLFPFCGPTETPGSNFMGCSWVVPRLC